MSPLQKLQELFSKFPGIGPRQAGRFVYFLLSQPESFSKELLKTVVDLKKEMSQCGDCYRYFSATKTDQALCAICENPNTEKTSIIVVEKDIDLDNIKRANYHKGKYFVLGGLLPILEKKPESRIRIKELEEVTSRATKDGLNEIVLALSANPIADHTIDFVKERLQPFVNQGLKITILGRGLSTGTELEYSDTDTIKNALKNRS